MEQMINSHIWHPDYGFLNERVRRVAEIIADYEPTLFLSFIPPKMREVNEEYPYALIHRPLTGGEYVVRRLKEEDIDERLLAWIWSADNERNDVLAQLEKLETAQRVMKLKEEEEMLAPGREFMASVLASPKHVFKHDGKKFDTHHGKYL